MKRTPLKRKSVLKPKPADKKKDDPAISKPASYGKAKKEKCPSVAVLDSLFSQYIRRFGECQLWGYGGVTCSTQLQCSHIHSRRFHSVRWDLGNAVCACAAHHRWQHDHPTLSTWALEELLGREHLEALRDRFLNGRKPTREEKIALAKWFKEELRKVNDAAA